MELHELIAGERDEVIRRWKTSVRGTIAPEKVPIVELIDHLPKFLDEIVVALREDADGSYRDPLSGNGTTAAEHGEHRLRLGFSLDAVVREYGALRDAIFTTARDRGVVLKFRAVRVLSNSIISGIARAVTEYTQQRDAESQRQANEHFAFIAHELRGPLSAATLALEVLKRRGQLPEQGPSVRALERGLRRALDLVDQTLKVSRVASGIELRREATTLRALFDEVELQALSEAEDKKIEVNILLQSDERIDVDRRLVGSAVSNLLRNAVKYSREGGTVDIRGSISNGRVTIEVEDSCGGLPPGDVEKVFAPFIRLDDRQSGFGLGLAIARLAADAHGGSIRVQNLPGKGCIFVLELPIAPAR